MGGVMSFCLRIPNMYFLKPLSTEIIHEMSGSSAGWEVNHLLGNLLTEHCLIQGGSMGSRSATRPLDVPEKLSLSHY